MPGKEILRFAPSPTGYLHVGAARTALFNWLYARSVGGEFHLRIEDTDQARLVKGAEQQIEESLNWLGLDRDGPVVHQSKRVTDGVYTEYAKQLVKNGWAYESKEDTGRVIRFQWPDDQQPMEITYFDLPEKPWKVTIDPKTAEKSFEDFVLVKSDGFPTYNFAHVVDDHELGVTRVIRGDEFTSSLNKYVALHEAFDWKPPKYNHVPPILSPGKGKLSKRDGAKDVLEYRQEGYLPEALANFIALIGWRPKGEQELFFNLEDLTAAFSLEGIQKSPGVFDAEKLNWMNREHMIHMDTAQLIALANKEGFWPDPDSKASAVVPLAVERSNTLKELGESRKSYFFHKPKVTKDALVGKENPETVGVWLEKTHRQLSAVPEAEWNEDTLKDQLKDVLEEEGLVPKQLYPILREALTAEPETPAIWEIMAVLGKKQSLERIDDAAALVA